MDEKRENVVDPRVALPPVGPAPVAIVQVALVPDSDGVLQVQVNASLDTLAAVGLLEAGKQALLAQSPAPAPVPSRLVRAHGAVPRL